MRCPFCQSLNVTVSDSRLRDEGTIIWRRRQCLSCNRRFSTKERIDLSYFTVIKKNSKKEEFSREKILVSILRSFGKRPIAEKDLEKATDEIISEIHKEGKPEIKTSKIGEMVLEKLKKLDLVAYIRFASVFKDFADIKSFKKELEDLEK